MTQQSSAAKTKWAARAKNRAPDLPGEEWRPIAAHPGYEASSEGRIRSTHTVLTPAKDKKGYPYVAPSVNGQQRAVMVHLLVATTFHGPCPDGHECRHKDGNPGNSRPDNLAWGTRLENQRDRIAHETTNNGESNGQAKITAVEASAIYARAHAGEKHAAIALEFGVSTAQVSAIKSGRAWSHVTGAEKRVDPARLNKHAE